MGSSLFYELAEASQNCIYKVVRSHDLKLIIRMEEDSRVEETVIQNGI